MKVTKNLITINIIVYIATLINEPYMTQTFALFYPTSPFFHWWQPLTHMFMHGGFAHIFFNMYTLYIFGRVVENIIGEKKFLIFYFICGFGAAALHMGVQYLELQHAMGEAAMGSSAALESVAMVKYGNSVGASGAIYGVLIGYAMLFPDSKMTLLFPPVTLSAKWMVAIFAAIEFLTGITGTMVTVAHFAHLGGMLFGFLLIRYWKHKGTLFNRENLNW